MARTIRVAVGCVAIFGLIFGCGVHESPPGKGTVRIAVNLTLSGSDPGDQAALNGVKFALQQVREVDGWTLALDVYDDSRQGAGNSDAGVENVRTMIQSGDLGMIGPFTSSIARAEIPIAAGAHLVIISPSNSHPCLTKNVPGCGDPVALRNGNPNNYFRVVTTDEYQSMAMADYFYEVLSLRSVGVLDDSLTGRRFAQAFETEFKARGGAVVHRSYSKELVTDFTPYLREFLHAGAQGVYVGGTDDQGACIPRRQMAALGINGWPYGGSDGVATINCIDDAAPAAAGMLVTNVGPDAKHIASAQTSVREFIKAFPAARDFGHFTMTAFDAAGILIHAIKTSLDAGADPRRIDAFRESVRTNVAATVGYAGTTGVIGFDQNGDTTAKVISIYQVEKVPTGSESAAALLCGTRAAGLCFVWVKNVTFDN
jgi:branched-chain amino acid transport system substrate-binding protein